jgi:hypothetical protein
LAWQKLSLGRRREKTAPAAPPEVWKADATVQAGEFKSGDVARVEAWALVRTPTKVFHVYWQDDAVKVEQGTSGA